MNRESSLKESGPHLYLPAAICNSCNSGNKPEGAQVDPAKYGGKTVLIQTLQCDFL